MFLPGQLVITEGNRKSWISRAVAWATGSWWTHAFIVVGPDRAIEATFPRVRQFSLKERLAQLEAEDRAYLVFDLDLTGSQRTAVIEAAESFIGKWYDFGQLLYYKIRGQFVKDGIGKVVCSRLYTGVFQKVGINLFPKDHLDEVLPSWFVRRDNLEDGYVTPTDFFYSILKIVGGRSSSAVFIDNLLPQDN